MKAFTQGITKDEFIKELEWHAEQDNFIKGTYGEGQSKGCAVGCAIKSINKIKGLSIPEYVHKEYETHLGIPEWLARVEDAIFEGVSELRSRTWPLEFARDINTKSDLNRIKDEFLIYILEQNIELQLGQLKKFPELRDVIQNVIYANEQVIWAKKTANSAAAESAAWSAMSVAMSAAAESAARSAAAAAYEKYADKLLELIRGCK
jgi:hypothetical protein